VAKTVGILTGGGDCPGLNAVIRAVVRSSDAAGWDTVAALEGWRGLVDGNFRDLGPQAVSGILPRGGTIIGTSRTNPFNLDGGVDKALQNFADRGLDALVVIGGEDTLGVAERLYREHSLPVVGVPKTIDNDLSGTDYTFGFDTAVTIATEAIDRLHTTAESHNRVLVCEVMGRHAGWIAAAGGLAGRKAGDAPHLILFPEIRFEREKFLARVRQCVTDHGYCVIVVSEGARYADGKFLAEAGTKDAFGHTQLGGVGPVVANMVREAFGYKFHWAVADYLQRAARHIASKVDVDQAYAVGKAAVQYAVQGRHGVMPAIKRLSSRPYRWKIVPVPLAAVANVEKTVPRHFITADGYGITAACRRYLEPLIGGEDYPPYKAGLPAYARLRGKSVRRRLNTPYLLK